MRLNQDAASIFCNGHKDPYIFCNGVQVWPAKVVTSHSIYILADPDQYTPISFRGLWWNGSQITTSMIAEASYRRYTSTGWSSISSSDLNDMLSSSGTMLSCNEVFIRLNSLSFSEFRWRTRYGAPSHKFIVTVNENSTTGIKTVGQNEFTQTSDSESFYVYKGDHL